MQNDIECNLVVENLSAFFDKELDEDLTLKVKHHLCNCLNCRREFSKLLKTQNLLKGYFKRTFVPNTNLDFEEILKKSTSSKETAPCPSSQKPQ